VNSKPGLDDVSKRMLGEVRDRWSAIGLSTEPADRVAAEEGVARVYQENGLAEPGGYEWHDSPEAGARSFAAECRRALDRTGTKDDAYQRLWIDRWHTNLGAVTRFRGIDEHAIATEMRLRRTMHWASQYAQFIPRPTWREPTWENAFDPLLQNHFMRDGALDRAIGVVQLGWVALWAGMESIHDVDLGIGGYVQAAENAGWWWPTNRVAIMTERPMTLILNNHGSLRDDGSPTIIYRDGYSVPSKVQTEKVESPSTTRLRLRLPKHKNPHNRGTASRASEVGLQSD